MSEIKYTGGPAFPLNVDSLNALDYCGMSLRDYFAAKAMQGRVAGTGKIPSGAIWDVNNVAKQAYAVADAMLEAREK